jgi:creatinine amidohydrolase
MFRQQDVNALIVVNGHGGNYVLANVVQEANADNAIQVGLYPSRDDLTEARHAARARRDSNPQPSDP